MVSIIGSVDNAGIWNTRYHLVFTHNEILQFEVMSGRERVSDIYKANMENPTRMVPVAGKIAEYSTTKQEVEQLVSENIRRGKEIEINIEKKLEEKPSTFKRIPYDSIESVELTNGTSITLPHLAIKVGRKPIKFHLLHNNYQGRGKLDRETFQEYRKILDAAFAEKLNVKE